MVPKANVPWRSEVGQKADGCALAPKYPITGHEREALAVLDREFPVEIVTGSQGIWALERARLAEKRGEQEKAKDWYGYVVRVWRHADTDLQPMVAEAREALQRLGRES